MNTDVALFQSFPAKAEKNSVTSYGLQFLFCNGYFIGPLLSYLAENAVI
jgi:hypothetical protein